MYQKKVNWLKVVMVGLLTIGLMRLGFAEQAPNPTPELQAISNQMISALKTNKASMTKNPQVVYDIVEKILLPHVDLTVMARSALGRDAWTNATSADQQAFTDQFKLLLLHTYAAGLSSYTDESVKFDAIRGGIQPDQTRVEVTSQIIRNDGPPITVSYRLVYETLGLNPAYDWYVYDFSVEGVSMIQSFRAQFAAELSNGESLAQLTATLQSHNTKVN